MIERLEERQLLTVNFSGAPTWNDLGPHPIIAGNNSNVIGPTAATSIEVGAITTLAIDPNNAKHVFAATVNGGVWQTADFTIANPVWSTTSDQLPSLAISAIAFSPAISNVIYAGTGSYSSTFGGVGGTGLGGSAVGIYKSIDGGMTWQILNPGGIFTGMRIRRIVPTTLNGGQTVFLATTDTNGANTGGIYRSDNGGTSWTRLSGTNGLPNAGVTDLVANPSNPNQFFAAVAGGSGGAGGTGNIFRVDLSVNTTWTNITGNINTLNPGVLNSAIRVELSVSAAGVNPIWVSVTNSAGFYADVFRAVNTATPTWALVGPGGLPADVLEGNQGNVHGALLADPNSDTIVYLGGDARQNVSPFSCYVARGDSGANTWTAMTPIDTMTAHPGQTVIPTNNGVTTAPHPDTRNFVIASGGVLLVACDGGVYQAANPTGAGPALAWTSVNGNLEDSELYQANIDDRNSAATGDDLFEAAAQDNDTSERDAGGTWNTQVGGDGTVVLADPISDTRYFSSQNYFMRRAIGGGGLTGPAGTVAGTGGKILNQAVTGTYAETFPFSPAFQINKGDIGAGNTARVILGGNQTLYVSGDQAANYTSIGGTTANNPNAVANLTARVLTIAFGATTNTNACYVGMSDGNIAFTSNITTAGGGFNLTTFLAAAGGEVAQDMVIDPNDANTLYVVTLTRVFVTTNGGTIWTNITDNLGPLFAAGFPTFNGAGQNSITLFNNGTATKVDDVVLVGGPGGVFRRSASAAPGTAVWSQYGALPRTLVDSLTYDRLSDTLLAGTFGRGAWAVANVAATIFATGVVQICGDTDFVNENDSFRLVRDQSNNLLLDVFENNNTPIPNFQVPIAIVQKIVIYGGGGNNTLIVDSSNGLISVPQGTDWNAADACPGMVAGEDGFNQTILQQIAGANTPILASDVYTVGPTTPGNGMSVVADTSGNVQTVNFFEVSPTFDSLPAPILTVNATNASNIITYTSGKNSFANFFATPAITDPAWGEVSVDEQEPIEFINKRSVIIDAGLGDDVLVADNANVPTGMATITFNGDEGNDTVRLEALPALGGTFLSATVNALGDPTRPRTGDGNDTIDASLITTNTPLTLNGGAGNDIITGGTGTDSISGGIGDDIIFASPGNDTMNGDDGVDQIKIIGRIVADMITANQTTATALAVTFNGNARSYTVNTMEEVLIDGGLGDDIVAINVVDSVPPASSLPFDVIGNSPNASDRLIVNDDGLGDLVIQRQAPDGRSGSITIGSTARVAGVNSTIDPPKAQVVYESIERVDITPIDTLGRTGSDHGGQLIVFHYDDFESNDSELTATPIIGTPIGTQQLYVGQRNIDPGPLSTLPLPFPSVPGDSDWYEFRPDRIGTYRFDVLFEQIDTTPNGRPGLPDDGNLKIEVFKADGTLIGTSDISSNTAINIKTHEFFDFSAAANTSYYLHVVSSNDGGQGTSGAAINNYELNVSQVDNGGLQVTGVFPNNVAAFDLFHPKSNLAAGATPLIFSLTVNIRDLPNRAPGDPYPALDVLLANSAAPGLYSVVGDHVGHVDISSVVVTNNPVVIGQPATATVTLNFAKPLPDDRFTLTLLDGIQDPAGNKLDGESDASEPGAPSFPSGNNIPGGNFVARFTVDSRPEIGTAVAADIDVDINGNYFWDPANSQIGNDFTNVDLSFSLAVQNSNGFIAPGSFNVNDLLFEGKFANPAAGTTLPNRLYDTLGAYGVASDLGGIERWLIDIDGDGVVTMPTATYADAAPTPGKDIIRTQPSLGAAFNVVGAIPVVGNFNAAHPGDEIGLYNAGKWGLDINADFVISPNEIITDNLNGSPIVGDFDGDGLDDLAVFNNNQFSFDFANNGFSGVDKVITWGFPGTLDKPVVADIDQDGIDDVGLWEPRNSASLPREAAEWYFLISGAATTPITFESGQIAPTTTQFFSTNLKGNTTIPTSNVLVRVLSGANFGAVRTASFNPTTGQVTLNPGQSLSSLAVGDIFSIGGQPGVTPSDHAFRPTPFGNDIVAEFGDETALPLIGNLDPPLSPTTVTATTSVAGDYDNSGLATSADYTVWRGTFGSTTNLLADGNHNLQIDAGDYVVWRHSLGVSSPGSSLKTSQLGMASEIDHPLMVSGVSASATELQVSGPRSVNNILVVEYASRGITVAIKDISGAAPPAEARTMNTPALDRAFGFEAQLATAIRCTLIYSAPVDDELLLLGIAGYHQRPISLSTGDLDLVDEGAVNSDAVDIALTDFLAGSVLESTI